MTTPASRPCLRSARIHPPTTLALAALTLLVPAANAQAAISDLFGSAVACAVQSGGNAGERHCSGIYTTFDGAPIDVNVGFPPEPAAGPDGDFPIVGVFHGWGGEKLALTSSSMQQWLNKGYAVFSMSDRGWGNSCGATDPKRLQPGVCDDGYNHLMDTRYEVRDAQEVFEALADQAATGATSGEGLIDPTAIAAMGSSYGGGISMALGALRNRKMMGAHEGSPNADGYLVAWTSPGGRSMEIAAVQPDIPWTDLAYSLQPNGHTLDYVEDAPYDLRGRGGIMKQSFVSGLYGLGLAGSNYAPAGSDPDADLHGWYSVVSAGEPYDDNPVALDIVDELTRHHSSYYIDDSVAPAPMLISNGFTDDLFPPDEAIRYYNRTRATHPGTPVSLLFSDHGHQRGQNKGADESFRNSQLHEWFDYYVRGVGPLPFQGVQTLTQNCGGPSEGPFQAATWEALAPGEFRLDSATAQIIASSVGSDGPVGQAYDPIAGPGACATADSSDQAGAATYRSDPMPTGGLTLMGSPTILVDILSPGPNSQVAARLLDVDPVSGDQILVARGLYRPELRPTTASCQVFQLHPNGWTFEEGHIVKLELLPSDKPYGRESNGQAPITVENLRLRLPVVEAVDGVLVHAPSPKALPDGYALGSDVTVGIDAGCVADTTTTTTSTTNTTSTTEDTTTTTTLTTYDLSPRRVVAKAEKSSGAANGKIVAKGTFTAPPSLTTPPSFSIRVQDGGTLDESHTFDDCDTLPRGKIRCKEAGVRAVFRPKGEVFKWRIAMRDRAVEPPLAGPVSVTLLHNSAVVRSGTLTDCKEKTTSLRCRD